MRIYELAKKISQESKKVVAECERLGIAVKNHMSSLTDAEADRVTEALRERLQKRQAQESKKAKERELIGALVQQRDVLQQQQIEEARMLGDARQRRLADVRAEDERQRAEQQQIKASQQDRAVQIAEEAAMQRMKVSEAAQAAMRAEMELLAKARKLREVKEKKEREEAAKRAAVGEAPAPVEEARGGGRMDRGVPRGVPGGPGGPRRSGGPGGPVGGGPGGKLRPTQVFNVGDVVRRSGAPAGERPADGGRPGEAVAGRGAPTRPGERARPGGPGRGAPGRGGSRDRDRARQQQRESRDFRSEGANPLDGRINRGSGRRRGQPLSSGVTEVNVHGTVTTRELADLLAVPTAEVIRAAFDLGEILTINQSLTDDLLVLVTEAFGAKATIAPDSDESDLPQELIAEDSAETLVTRPPVVTVMGHVDHGKTSLLDAIRKTTVAVGEAGGITQHIGAYQVATAHGKITFLDTPGHAAFTAMRARGAEVTDLVILVVAANDGIQPQTVEAINHAKAAGVPLIVAVNKMDVPGASVDRVKKDMMQHGLVSEELGGDTTIVPISAKANLGLKELLEIVALQAELLELKANPDRHAVGTVIESQVHPARGALATILVQRGTLRVGDLFLVGNQWGRVRAMIDEHGREVTEALPSRPVEVLGLSGAPEPGEQFVVLDDERLARSIAERRGQRRRAQELAARQQHVTLETFHSKLEEGAVKELNLVIKADVQGSVEAIASSLRGIVSEKIRLRVLHSGVGGINESDVQLADVSDAIIIGFQVRAETSARQMAERRGVQIQVYSVIYDLIDQIRASMTGMLEPTIERETTGSVEVLEVFKTSRGSVAGCIVRDGQIDRNSRVKIFRNNAEIFDGELTSLRRIKEDVSVVKKGLECGVLVKDYTDIKVGDVIEPYKTREVAGVL